MKAPMTNNSNVSFNNQNLSSYVPFSFLKEQAKIMEHQTLKKYKIIIAILDAKGIVKSKQKFSNELLVALKEIGVPYISFSHKKFYVIVLRSYDDQFILKKLSKMPNILKL